MKIITKNRKASFEFDLQDRYEAGIVLSGSEVKSICQGKINIAESFVDVVGNEAFLVNSNIEPYENSGYSGHDPKAKRKLLLHRRELDKLRVAKETKGMGIVPTIVYFSENGKIKVEIAIGKGKKLYDKRETIKRREWDREAQRARKMTR